MPSIISGDANVSATEFGYLDGVTSALQTQMDSKLPLAGGKILQIVRATDSTNHTTTSTTLVDVTGVSVTITPQKSDSAVILIASFMAQAVTIGAGNTQARGSYAISDSSNNVISGAEDVFSGFSNMAITTSPQSDSPATLIAYATPATTSAVTYKLRMRSVATTSITTAVRGDIATTQLYAIEVSA